MLRSFRVPLCALLLLGAGASDLAADEVRDLFLAARAGDLAAVEKLVEGGADPDPHYKWGKTPLAVAAERGHADIVGFLLEKGADADAVQTFHGFSALQAALAGEHWEVAGMLLAAGADGREDALGAALEKERPEVARVAVESGPLLESRWAELEAALVEKGGEWATLAEAATTRPDPPPPTLSADELAALAGRYEAWDEDRELILEAGEGSLVAHFAGAEDRRILLKPAAANLFRSAEGDVEVLFWGRAGTVEGVRWSEPSSEPTSFRAAVAEVVAGAPVAETPMAGDPVRTDGRWPSFRGPSASGVADGAALPVDWDLESGRNVLWTAEVPGYGNSSPIVWGDTVFVTTAVAEGLEAELETGLTGSGREIEDELEFEHAWQVVAFDRSTGERRWTTEVGRGKPRSRRHFKASQASSTPATDGKHVVAVFPTAGMVCLEATTGEVLWRRDLGALPAGTFSDPTVEWGYASSPILWEDLVLVQADIHEGPWIGAFSLSTGEPLWRREREVAPSWATPTVIDGPEGPELVANASTIRAYDPRTGEELWSLEPNSELVIATPIAGDGRVYVSAGYPPAKPIYALRPGRRGDFRVDPGEESEILAWSHARGGAYMPTPLRYRGRLWIVHHNARLVAYDLATGNAVHKARFSKGGTFTASPVAAEGRIYTGTEEGLLYVLDAGPEPKELAVHDLGEPIMATPAISAGTLIVRTPDRLIALADDADG